MKSQLIQQLQETIEPNSTIFVDVLFLFYGSKTNTCRKRVSLSNEGWYVYFYAWLCFFTTKISSRPVSVIILFYFPHTPSHHEYADGKNSRNEAFSYQLSNSSQKKLCFIAVAGRMKI